MMNHKAIFTYYALLSIIEIIFILLLWGASGHAQFLPFPEIIILAVVLVAPFSIYFFVKAKDSVSKLMLKAISLVLNSVVFLVALRILWFLFTFNFQSGVVAFLAIGFALIYQVLNSCSVFILIKKTYSE